ncbi:hypothetical protein HU200_028596 [Digitaria exilis]|uniref:Leucine-rich repeat-containing N-terminal plant-type domain-containing protein n=1 Tax=Digitaria exilis TaxID=1010633 RepID=A0A835EQ01_9POAL|nr:hypothetical protein HU200_028596 [Digitaria exilis]
MASILWVLLFFIAQLHTLLSSSSAHQGHGHGGNLTHFHVPFLCHPDQAKALLQLKKSFFRYSTTRLSSWRNGTDCCLWEGIDCDASSGHVTILDINNRGLFSYGLDPAVFNLTSLRRLDLSMNDFGGYDIPATGFERFTFLTHLNLSNSGFYGQIPIGISKLVNLLSLDLSTYSDDGDAYYYDFSGPSSYYRNNHLRECSFGTLVANLSNLRELYLDMVDLSLNADEWATSLATYVPRLQVLSLANCGLGGPISKSLSRLHSLVVINLERNYGITAGPFPEFFMDFLNLTVLQLSWTNLEGWYPTKPFRSANLRVLDLSCNENLSGNLPNFSNASALETLRLDWTNFSYARPTSSSNFRSLKALSIDDLRKINIYDTGFTGLMPAAIGRLTNLRNMYINYCGFSGPMPAEIGNLTNLKAMNIKGQNSGSPIPYAIGQLRELAWLVIQDCNFPGSVPSSIANLTRLILLDISSNSLDGNNYFCLFWRLSKLNYLYLSNNELHVTDTDGNNPLATYLAGLYELGLASSKIYQFPSFLRRLKYLSALDLSSNEISGDVPNWVLETWRGSLNSLNLSHNMLTGMQISSDVIPCTIPLEVLDLSFNRISGQVPMPNSSASILEYSNNNFSSLLPNWTLYLNHTRYLSLSKNNINGHIPISICNSMLNVFDISHNSFSGLIPSCIIENGLFVVLNLRDNHFKGTLPSNITTGCALQTIDLHGNKIEGRLPRALCNCTDLEVLDFGGNRIADIFPYWLSGLPELSVLVLTSNQFYGTIGDIVPVIDLSSNNFSGNLRTQWFIRLKSMTGKGNSTRETISAQHIADFYQDSIEITYKGSFMAFERILTTLTAIDLSNNQLEGNIPESFGKLVSLRVLNMSHNFFTGKIPAELGGMTALESLDLSWNQLSEGIPQELADLTFLEVLNLSYNHLVGKIPQSRQFSTFDSSSFEGNEGLCGPPLSTLPCGASPYTPSVPQVNRPFHHVDVVLFLFVGLGFGAGFAASVLVKWGGISTSADALEQL